MNRNGVSVPNLRINVEQNEISYTFSSTPARSPKLYWSLPSQFTGNKVSSMLFSSFKKIHQFNGLGVFSGDVLRRSDFHHATLRRTSRCSGSTFQRQRRHSDKRTCLVGLHPPQSNPIRRDSGIRSFFIPTFVNLFTMQFNRCDRRTPFH